MPCEYKLKRTEFHRLHQAAWHYRHVNVNKAVCQKNKYDATCPYVLTFVSDTFKQYIFGCSLQQEPMVFWSSYMLPLQGEHCILFSLSLSLSVCVILSLLFITPLSPAPLGISSECRAPFFHQAYEKEGKTQKNKKRWWDEEGVRYCTEAVTLTESTEKCTGGDRNWSWCRRTLIWILFLCLSVSSFFLSARMWECMVIFHLPWALPHCSSLTPLSLSFSPKICSSAWDMQRGAPAFDVVEESLSRGNCLQQVSN